MLPLRDENPTRLFPILTVGLIAVNVAVFVWQKTLPQDESLGSEFARVCEFGAIPDNVVGGGPTDDAPCSPYAQTHPVLSLVTSQFLHADWLHLGGNMLFLWIFGNNVEDRLGRLRFLPFYLLGGVIAALAQTAAGPDSPIPLIGASGAIAAVLGAYIVLYPRARIWTLLGFILVRIPAWLVLGGWILFQFLYAGGETTGGDQGGVAYWAHVGGFVAGLVLITPALIGRPPPPRPSVPPVGPAGW